MGRRTVVGGLADSAGVPVGPFPPLGGGERAGQDAVDAADGAGLHRVAYMRATPVQPAIVAGPRAPAAQARTSAGLSGDDRGAAVPQDDQAVCGERLQGVPDDAGPDALQGAQLGDRWQFVARGEGPGPNGLGQRRGDLLPGRARVARVDRQHRDVAMLDEWPAGAGHVAAALELRVQLVENGAAHLSHLHRPEGGLDGAPDEPLVGLPRGHVPLRDGCVLVHQLRHGGAGLGRSALGCLLEQPAELDLRLLLGLDGGLEANRPPGERIGPGVHGDPERPARQLLYVTLSNSRHSNTVTRTSDIRSTKRSTDRTSAELKPYLTWERFSRLALTWENGAWR